MTREDLEYLEDNLKELRDITKIAAEAARKLEYYYAVEKIEPSWELDERVAKALVNATKVMEEITKIEKDFIPPWD